MKRDKKIFIVTELLLAAMLLVVAIIMIFENIKDDVPRISVIVQDSDSSQWASLQYGIEMAARDLGMESIIVSTPEQLSAENEKELIENELLQGADALIIQPAIGEDVIQNLRAAEKKVPVVLLEKVSVEIVAIEADNEAMGKTLAEEINTDYNKNLRGKIIGIVSEKPHSKMLEERKAGLLSVLEEGGAIVGWDVSKSEKAKSEMNLEALPKVDIVIALDDSSTVLAGETSMHNDLHGAVVYGIGHSMEACYYMDAGYVECLVIPNQFNVGYQSVAYLSERLERKEKKRKYRDISYSVLRRENLFSKENQEIIYTMSQ